MNFIIEEPSKPWSVDQFEHYRSYMTRFVRGEITPIINERNNLKILIHGQVKVGKREIVEYIALRDINNSNRIHIFISAFHRKADESQRTELENHGITVFSIYDKKKQREAIDFISDHTLPNIAIIIHWDECDYGTGEHQSLAQIYAQFRDYPNIIHILYSATPEELLYSKEISTTEALANTIVSDIYETGIVKRYDPPPGYCGAKKFLDEGLVTDAIPFFDVISSTSICLTEQGKEIVDNAKKCVKKYDRDISRLKLALADAEDDEDANKITDLSAKIKHIKSRNIIVLRVSYKNGDDDDDMDPDADADTTQSCKAIYEFLKNVNNVKELEGVYIYADKHDVKTNKNLKGLKNVLITQIEWSNKDFWDRIPKDHVVIITHDQTSTRSTEWKCHDRVFATHDYRKRITFNAYAQAILRPAHFEQTYHEFQRIQIYGHLKTLLFLDGRIPVDQYLNNDWISRKVPKSDPPRYRIKNILTANAELPISLGGGLPNPEGYLLEVAQRMLLQLGCTNNGDTKLSQRIAGKTKKVPVIVSAFYPCEKENKDDVVATIRVDFAQHLRGRGFNTSNLFREDKKDPLSGKWMGYMRKYDVFKYEQVEHSLWGIRIGAEESRITVCYQNEQVGLAVRVATGECRQINNLETYKSMYQS
jgi:hypothetical protein